MPRQVDRFAVSQPSSGLFYCIFNPNQENNMSTKKQSSSKSSKKNEVISRKPDPKIRKFLLQFLQQNDLSQRRIADITKARYLINTIITFTLV